MSTNYCTEASIARSLSAAGLDLDIDDDPAVIDDIIEEASAVFEEYCLPHYAALSMASNRWCVSYCSIIGAYLCSIRRGNPAPSSIAERYDRALERLEMVRVGGLNIPGLARRRVNVPMHSRMRIKLDPVPHSVVERRASGTRNPPRDYVRPTDGSEPIIPPGA